MPSFSRSFTELSVGEHAPALSGVYGISNASEWVYIDVSDNIREILLEHLQETSTLLVIDGQLDSCMKPAIGQVGWRGTTGSF